LSGDHHYNKRVENLARTRIGHMMNFIMREKGYNSRRGFVKHLSLANYEAFQKEYELLTSNPRFIF
jgi:hypothetical protein